MAFLEYLHSRAARRASYGLLLAAMLLVVLVYPILEEFGCRRSGVLSAFFIIVLLGCLAAAMERTRALAIFIAAVLGLEIVAGIFDLGGPGAESTLQHAARLVVLLLTTWILLRDVLGATSVSTDTILGAVCVYALLGMAGAEVYALVLQADPEAFEVSAHLARDFVTPYGRMSVTSYFSFVTLTTVGYGDISPVNAVARSFATVQAVAGQLYLAIIVARLVALHVTSARSKSA